VALKAVNTGCHGSGHTCRTMDGAACKGVCTFASHQPEGHILAAGHDLHARNVAARTKIQFEPRVDPKGQCPSCRSKAAEAVLHRTRSDRTKEMNKTRTQYREDLMLSV